MTKLITVCSDQTAIGIQQLFKSLNKFEWDADVLVTEWKGFGTKLLTVYQYLKDHPEVDSFFFCDAYDVVVLSTMEEAMSKLNTNVITFSGEKNCWPDKAMEAYYDTPGKTEWCFLNSGLYFAPSELFISLFDYNMPTLDSDDQLWATTQLIFNPNSKIVLDVNCKVFQSYSFISNDDFGYENNRLQNLKTGEQPVFAHGNGRTDLSKVYDLL